MILRFANFYRRFIQGFSRIAVRLTSILKTPDRDAFIGEKDVADCGTSQNEKARRKNGCADEKNRSPSN